VFSVSVVVGAAAPTAVCRWGLCPRCPGVGRRVSGVYVYIIIVAVTSMAPDMKRKRDTGSVLVVGFLYRVNTG